MNKKTWPKPKYGKGGIMVDPKEEEEKKKEEIKEGKILKSSNTYKPFKMKGSPMKRNFGIGETENPDKNTPNLFLDKIGAALQNTNWGDVAKKSLAAGMRTLKGGYDAFQPTTTKDEEEELSTEDLFDKFQDIDPTELDEEQKAIYDKIMKGE